MRVCLSFAWRHARVASGVWGGGVGASGLVSSLRMVGACGLGCVGFLHYVSRVCAVVDCVHRTGVWTVEIDRTVR